MRRAVVGLAIALAAFAPSRLRADDTQIAQQIVEQFNAHKSDGTLRGFKINLDVEDGTVLLTGKVSSAEQEQLAVEIAQSVDGVTRVIDDLEIVSNQKRDNKPRQAEEARPTETKQVQSPRRFQLGGFSPLKLLGQRPSQAESQPAAEQETAPARRTNAQTASRAVAAPHDVHVAETPVAYEELPQTAPQITDQQIAQQVFERLQQYKQSGQLQGFHLDMRVEQGSVVLDGHVSYPEQKQLALEVARRVPGVYQVVDMIRVEAQPTMAHVIPASVTGAVDSTGSTRRTASAAPPATLTPTGAAPLAAMPHGAYYTGQVATGMPQAMPIPVHYASPTGMAQVRYDHPQLPSYAWPSYAAHPNYAAVTYPRQYSPTAWPYIGPFYPYPQVPLGWRKVTLEWDDGWWQLDFKEK